MALVAQIVHEAFFKLRTLPKPGDFGTKANSGCRIELFEDAGHALFVDDSERFNSVVESFLKEAIVGWHAGNATD